MIKAKKMMRKNINKKGFSLVEMLLTVMVVTGLLVAVFELLEDYVEKELAIATADYMENIALAVQDIVESPEYFQEAYALANARPSDTLELSFNDLVNGFGTIPASTRLNASVRERNPMGAGISVLLRIADNPADLTDIQSFDILVATNERIIDERLRRAATESGGYGGLIREAGDPIRNAFSSWEIPVSNFSGTTWANTVSTVPASIDEGGYLAHYRHVSFEDIAGDYMFRVSVPGRPDLNRMYTTLNMGNNNIMGTDNLDLSQDLNLRGQALVNGNVAVGGATRIQQGDVYAGQRFSATHAVVRGTGAGRTGNLTVDDSINMGRANMTGQINANEATMLGGLNTSNQVDSTIVRMHGGIASAGRIQATTLTSGGGASRPNVNVSGTYAASDLRTGTLNVTAGNVGVMGALAQGSGSITGNVSAPVIGVDNLRVGTFGLCNRGC